MGGGGGQGQFSVTDAMAVAAYLNSSTCML